VGGNLEEAIRRESHKGTVFSRERIYSWLAQCVIALCHIHQKKIVHRDIKPSNIFLDANDNIKLADPGISKALANTYAFAKTVCGTPYFMSPELLRHEN